MQLSPAHQIHIFFKDFPTFSMQFPMVSDGSCWYPLVNFGYPWLSNICEIVCAFAIIFPVICRNLLQSLPDKIIWRQPGITMDNQRQPRITTRKGIGKGANDSPNIYDLNRRIYKHYTSGNDFLEAPYPIFVKVKSAPFSTWITDRGLKSQNFT